MSQVLEDKINAAANQKYDTVTDLLTFLKQEKIRRPDLVLLHGQYVLHQYPRRLQDQLWSVYEQVLLAALDVHDKEVALSCLDVLKSKFPTSLRVRRLEGMVYVRGMGLCCGRK